MTNTESTPQTPEFDLADRCLKARRHAGLSQDELAQRIDISVRTVSRYETTVGTRPSRLILRQWAFACGISYEWLRDGDGVGQSSPGGNQNGGTSDQQEDSSRCKAA